MSGLDLCFESHRRVDELVALGFGLNSQACHLGYDTVQDMMSETSY